MKGGELKLTEVEMTVLTITGLILLFMIVPYLTGNIYGFIFRGKRNNVDLKLEIRKNEHKNPHMEHFR